jgi:hypothetical protein
VKRITRFTLKAPLQLSLLLLVAGTVVACERDRAKYSERADKIATSKRQAIAAEIKNLGGHEWAGEYYAGDGLGVNTSLFIAPDSGYVFEWHGCLGLYDRNYGAVVRTNGRIRLSFTFENQRKGFQGIAPELVPISWGSRRYIIPADDVVGFCNSINQGREPRTSSRGFYLLRRGDENAKVRGFPKVPEEYQQYLLKAPIQATIVAVGTSSTRRSAADWKFKDTTVTLDAGAEQGVREGMELIVTKPRDAVDSVRITEVEKTRSKGIMTQIGEGEPVPAVGWQLSTQPPWHAERTR